MRQPAQAGQTKSAHRFRRGSPGKPCINKIFLPCEVLREYFYRLPHTADRVDHPTLYEVLRIPASASPSELRVAFKLRDLELRKAVCGAVSEWRWNGNSTSSVSRNCGLAMTRWWPIPKLRPRSLWWIWLSSCGWRSFARRAKFFANASSRFHPIFGVGGSMCHCENVISTTTAHCAATCVANWSSGSIQPLYIHSGPHLESVEASVGKQIEVEGTFVQSGKYRNAARGGSSLPGKLHCRVGWRSNCRPIFSCKWNLPKLPIIASASTRGLWIRSAGAWNIRRSSERIYSACVLSCAFPMTLMSPRSAGVRL